MYLPDCLPIRQYDLHLDYDIHVHCIENRKKEFALNGGYSRGGYNIEATPSSP